MSQPRPHLFWEGVFVPESSFARANRRVVQALLATGLVDVTLVPWERRWPATPELDALAHLTIARKGLHLQDARRRPTLWVSHRWPPRPGAPGRLPWVAWQPWEYSLVPVSVRAALAAADEVWASSVFTRNAFVRSGLDPERVHVMGYGADPEVFSPDGPREPLGDAATVRFLAVGGTIYRKGVDVLRAAFARTFVGNAVAELVVKDSGVDTFYRGSTAHAALAQAAAAGELRYLRDDWEEQRLAGLFRACDVVVAPYRGEGFCMPALEAMASGRPVIATKGGATDDFVDERVGWVLPAEPRSVGSTIFGMPVDGTAFLLEPDVDALAGALRSAAADAGERLRRGAAGRERALERWTWSHVARRVLARLDARFGTDLARRDQAVSAGGA